MACLQNELAILRLYLIAMLCEHDMLQTEKGGWGWGDEDGER